jgi:hypothetical protein
MKERSSRQDCESGGVKVPVPSIACFGRLAYPRHAEVTKHDGLGRRSHRLPCRKCGGRSDQGGEQTERPEHKEMTATSKNPHRCEVAERSTRYADPCSFGEGRCCGGSNRQEQPANRRGRGPGILGRTGRDNVGKIPLAAGAGSNLQRLLERGKSRSRGEPNGIGA